MGLRVFWRTVACGSVVWVAGSCALANAQGPSAALPDAPTPSLALPAVAQPSGTDEKLEPVTLKRLPLRFVTDEAAIFTSPARIRKNDLKWLIPLGAATGAALATDSYTMRNVVTRDPGFNDDANTVSDALRDTAIGVPVLMYGVGLLTKDEDSREAGLLGGEAMVDAYTFDEIIKFATLRERPKYDNADGKFFVGSSFPDPSFVSGHSIIAWSSAAVLAEEYHRPWQQASIYTLATGVSLTRVLGQDHFPTDALLGSAAGWLIGHYVYKKHHRPDFVKRMAERKHSHECCSGSAPPARYPRSDE